MSTVDLVPLVDGDRPVGVFTGGSLLVSAAARTDLIAPEQTEPLARQQYASLQRLARMPDEVAVWPTHGAGSFCSAPPGAQRASTIGAEKANNPLLRASTENAFVAALTGSLGSSLRTSCGWPRSTATVRPPGTPTPRCRDWT